MSHISAAVEYALHTLIYLVDLPSDAPAPSSRDLAILRGLPAKFVAGVMTKLSRAGIVVATQGVDGGIRLARDAGEISFLDVVFAVDGRKPIFECRNVRRTCALFGEAPPTWATSGTCGIHAVMLEADARMKDVLRARTLRDMADLSVLRVPSEFRAETRAWLVDRAAARKRKATRSKDSMNADTMETHTCQS